MEVDGKDFSFTEELRNALHFYTDNENIHSYVSQGKMTEKIDPCASMHKTTTRQLGLGEKFPYGQIFWSWPLS